jgi:4-hydroxy-2-oxoheptanedioate aldolase
MPYQPRRGLRASLRSGEALFGLLALSGSAQLVEMGGFLGLDFAFLDLEHTDGIDTAGILHLVRAADAAGLPSLVRVAGGTADEIQRVLDYGAAGICVPHVRTAAAAADAVAAAKYPPEGRRSTCPYIRANAYGGRADVSSYTRVANEETVVMVLVEDPEGVANLEEIAAVPGLDALGVGLSDLARSLGLDGDAVDPRIDQARINAAALARRHGLAAWTTLTTSPAIAQEERAGELADRLAEGFNLFTWQDTAVFREAILTLREVRRQPVGQPG